MIYIQYLKNFKIQSILLGEPNNTFSTEVSETFNANNNEIKFEETSDTQFQNAGEHTLILPDHSYIFYPSMVNNLGFQNDFVYSDSVVKNYTDVRDQKTTNFKGYDLIPNADFIDFYPYKDVENGIQFSVEENKLPSDEFFVLNDDNSTPLGNGQENEYIHRK
ncbi:hypothetical protein CEXT_265261 [Caerostris extrusa]|uniref:Uncharacterized protein n=1 Tax=Caerostris extrusa TaxID=172846 RepID=A0AAV4UVC2_CAEEX|nr:hypothetical protein CEXT_265261 [Caerostris extrusa]